MTKPTLIEQAKQALEGTTPGPWRVSYERGTTKIFSADNESLMCDETYYPWVPSNLNDWDLIALAPQMAQALIAAEEMAEALRKVFSTHQNLDKFERLLAAHAAYRKATEGAE